MYRFCRSESGFWHARLPPRLPSGPGRPRIGPPAAYPLFASGLNADLPPVVARADYSPLRPARLPSSSPSPLTPPTVKPNPSTSLLDLCPIGNSFPSSSRPTDVTICATQLLKVRRLYSIIPRAAFCPRSPTMFPPPGLPPPPGAVALGQWLQVVFISYGPQHMKYMICRAPREDGGEDFIFFCVTNGI